MCEPLLERWRRVLGPDHPDTLRAANRLAVALWALGDYQTGRRLFEDTLNRRRVLGPDHPDTLASAHHLAEGPQALGEGPSDEVDSEEGRS